MTTIQRDYFTKSLLGFSMGEPTTKLPIPTLPTVAADLSQRPVSVGISNSTKAAVVGAAFAGALALSPTATLSAVSPIVTTVAILGYLAMILGRCIVSQLPALLSMLASGKTATEKRGSVETAPSVKEVVQPAQSLADEFLAQETPVVSPGIQMAQEFVQKESVEAMVQEFVAQAPSTPTKGQVWVNEFVPTPTRSAMVKEFEAFNAGQEMAEEFLNPAQRRLQTIQTQAPVQQKPAQKKAINPEKLKQQFLQFQIEQQRRAMRGKAKL